MNPPYSFEANEHVLVIATNSIDISIPYIFMLVGQPRLPPHFLPGNLGHGPPMNAMQIASGQIGLLDRQYLAVVYAASPGLSLLHAA